MFYHSNRVEDIQTISYCMKVYCVIGVIVNCPCQSALNICRLIICDQCHSYAINKRGTYNYVLCTLFSLLTTLSYHHHIWYDHQSHGAAVHCVHDCGS